MNFRAYARQAADQHGEDYTGVEPAVDAHLPSSCSYCGGTEFEPPEDNGQVMRAECELCGGTMVSHAGGTWQPDLIGSPHNHPSTAADPRSGGVGGIGAAPVKMREEDLSSRTAGFWDPTSNWAEHGYETGPVHRGLALHGENSYETSEAEDLVSRGAPHHEVAHAILNHVTGRAQGLGTSWTADHDHARRVAEDGGWHTQQRRGFPVVVHAAQPQPEHIEHDEATLRAGNVTPFHDTEAEVPLKRGAPAHITGVSWKPPLIGWKDRAAAEKSPTKGWVTHHFDTPVPHTAGANGELPQGFQLVHQNYKPGDDEHNDLDSNLPGWSHRLIRAHVDERPDEIARLEYSVSPEDKQIKIHETRVHSRYRRQGVASAMNAELTSRYPHHEIDRGPATEDGEEFRKGLDKAAGVDWCRHRHAEHCWLPRQEPAAVALFVPQDRGVCPWITASMQQINCPMSEPGPMAGMTRAAALDDPELRFHFLAAWRDVRAKATRIRREGGVNIISALVDGVTGHVLGDTGVYETQINYVPGTFKIGYWQCGCAWASYAWGRSPAFRRFEGRMCSHALALTYEAQSRGMFGREVREDTERPGWMRDKVRVRHDRPTRDHDVRAASRQAALDPDGVYPSDHGLALDRRPIEAFATAAMAESGDPADAMRVLLAAGIEHTAARDLLRDGMQASYDSWYTLLDRHPEVLHGRPELESLLYLSAKDEPDEPPTHAGVVLKAQDTGRILMIQRSHQDENDPAAGTWEFPGGGREPCDHNSLHSGIREFEEEVGHEFPTGGTVSHVWRSGPYQGHVVVVPSEKAIDFSGGRRTVNPDDPDGDDHEQSAWWDPDHARKNPALRPECRSSPWDKIKTASLDHRAARPVGVGAGAVDVGSGAVPANPHVADYASHDNLADLTPDWRPKAPPKAPERGEDVNPGSTGFATSQDPPEWDNAAQRAENTSMTMWSSLSELHDEPEPALPSTTAEEVEEPGERYRSQMDSEIGPQDQQLGGLNPTASVQDIVERFQATAGAKLLQTTGGPSDMDIASAARAHLEGQRDSSGMQHTALKNFSAAEQAELIGEGAGQLARNFGDLKIEGTHYEALAAAIAKEQSLADPDDLFI